MLPKLPFLATFAGLFTTALSFSDTSPYLLLSSSPLLLPLHSTHATTSSTFLTSIRSHLESCPSSLYILISQPHLHSTDLQHSPYLRDLAAGLPATNKWTPAHVAADTDLDAVIQSAHQIAQEKCDASTTDVRAGAAFEVLDHTPGVVRVEFDALPTDAEERVKAVEMNDSFLHTILTTAGERSWTLVFTSSPIGAESASKPKGYAAPVAELRKRVLQTRKEAGNRTTGGLFDNYQFFTPAIFMAYTALIFMIAVLYVAVSAISSVGVSYGAFEKDLNTGKKAQ